MTANFSVEVIGDDLILAALKAHKGSVDWLGDLAGEIGASAPYAVYVHEGTVYMPARPFISNAVQRNIGSLKRSILGAIPDGERATSVATIRGLNQIVEDARSESPVRTGYLRGSLYVKLR